MYATLSDAALLAEVVAADTVPLFLAALGGALALSLALAGSWRRMRPAGGTTRLRVALIGSSVALAAAALFAGLASALVSNGSLVRFDQALAAAMRATQPESVLRAFSLITHFGDTSVLTGLCIVGALWLLARRQRLLAAGWVAAIAGNSLLNRTLKAVFERVRPLHEHGHAFETSWSFPSGHASGTVVAYGMAAWILMRLLPARWHVPVLLVAVSIAFGTATSRVILQVHYFGDVLAGMASGTAWLSLCIMTVELLRRRSAVTMQPSRRDAA
jgi:membrane-associated phospholipid phosphatase